MILDKVTKGSFVLRLILGFIFLFSALTKLYDYSEFLYFVSEFFWVNNLLLITVTSILIAVELCLAFGFLVKTDTKVTSIISISLSLFLFIPFLIYLRMVDSNVNCMCFGSMEILNNIYIDFGKNLFIVIASFYIFVKESKSFKFDITKYVLASIILITTVNIYNFNNDFFVITAIEFNIVFNEIGELNEGIILLDARDKTVYDEGHIPKSISVPYLNERTEIPEIVISSLNNSTKIVTYCDSDYCVLSKLLASYISKNTNKKVYELSGGYNEWKSTYN